MTTMIKMKSNKSDPRLVNKRTFRERKQKKEISCFLVNHNEQADRRIHRLQARDLDENESEHDRYVCLFEFVIFHLLFV